jgi:ribonucleoside-diphosphate reductase alpha chain
MIRGIDYPDWITEEGLKTLKRQHLLEGETPNQMYERIADTLSSRYYEMLIKAKWSNKEERRNAETKFHSDTLKYLKLGWLCPSTPVLSNVGTSRGFGISCFIERVPDSLDGIYKKAHEMAMLTKAGGGVGVTMDKIRGRGEIISTGGFSEGTIPFMKVYDSAIIAANQGNVRRGSASINLPVRHKDIEEFLKIRLPEGDVNRQCLNLNHCVTIDDFFMESIKEGDSKSRDIFAKILSSRMKTGQPYIMYYHNVHNQRPKDMVDRDLKINGTNICCLSGDTEVITDNGILPIKDLINKNVKIFDGENWINTDSFKEYPEDNLIRITLKNGSYIDCNENHRWFAATNYNDIRKTKYKELKTKDLVEGYWLESNLTDASFYGQEDMKAAYLKGFLLGDGTHSGNQPILNVHSTKYNCISKLIESANELIAQTSKTNTIKDISFSEEVVNEDQFGKQVFKRMKGLTARSTELLDFSFKFKKSLPDFRNLNYNSKIEFLSGLLDSDGTYSTSGIQLSSIDEHFINQLQKFIISMGYNASIDVIVRENFNDLYRITIGNYDSFQLFMNLDCRRLEAPETVPNRRTTGYRQIVKIEKLNKKEKVYCPTLPTTGKFLLANGIMTGNTEILNPHDFDHTVVCCISSINLVKFFEWENDPEFLEFCYTFLDVNLEEFIQTAKHKPGFGAAIRFAEKSRAIGLGVLGWHTFLQQNNIPFNSIAARAYINKIGAKIKEAGIFYNLKAGQTFGNPEWCTVNRNLTLQAIAPTTTNSLVSGGVSQGIEPIICNAWIQNSAKGTFIRKNETLKKLMETKYPEHNTQEFWTILMQDKKGSIQEFDFFTDEEKEVFLTAYEINQLELIRNANVWQSYVDQGISLNLFFPADVDQKWLAKCHLEAWEIGIKTLYYVRTESILSRNMNSNTFSDCVYCE